MTPQETADKRILWVLHEIQKQRRIQEYGLSVIEPSFKELIDSDTNTPSLKDVKNILLTQLERRFKVLEIVNFRDEGWEDLSRCILQIDDTKKFEKLYKKYKRKFPKELQKNVLRYGLLKLDLVKGKISYSNLPAVEVELNQKSIKLLILLMRNKRVVEYHEIAKDLKLNCWREGVVNSEISHQVNSIKKDLVNLLKKAGMSNAEIHKMITNKEKIGYKLTY